MGVRMIGVGFEMRLIGNKVGTLTFPLQTKYFLAVFEIGVQSIASNQFKYFLITVNTIHCSIFGQ